MRNIRLTLQYHGTNFSGFELQPGKRTIRGELEKALHKVFKTRIKVQSASRTDSGVHALGQVISFKTTTSIPLTKLPIALNSVLPEDIRVVKAEAVGKGFNARFSAKAKTYEYLIYNGQIMPPHLRRIVWHIEPRLHLTAMRRAARFLVGKHDFSSFCASGGDNQDHVREIHSLVIGYWSLVIWGGLRCRVVRIRVTGNGFLYKMVRNIVGTLLEVGLGKLTPSDVKRILLAKDRKLAGRTAPAQGLCLVGVNY